MQDAQDANKDLYNYEYFSTNKVESTMRYKFQGNRVMTRCVCRRSCSSIHKKVVER